MKLAIFFRIAAIGIGILILNGCASLSEKQCRNGDWQGIGMRDGANGYTEFRVSDHQEACAKYGIVPDSRTYEAGRQRGLERYCTLAGGLRAGRNGGSYAGVCPAAAESAFLRAFQLGLELNRVESRLSAVRSERNSIYYRLHEIGDSLKHDYRDDRRDNDKDQDRDRKDDRRDDRRGDRERDALMFRLRELEREQWHLDDEYRNLEWEARRLR